jgi:hypothetical protein
MILKNEQEVVVDSPTFVCPGRKWWKLNPSAYKHFWVDFFNVFWHVDDVLWFHPLWELVRRIELFLSLTVSWFLKNEVVVEHSFADLLFSSRWWKLKAAVQKWFLIFSFSTCGLCCEINHSQWELGRGILTIFLTRSWWSWGMNKKLQCIRRPFFGSGSRWWRSFLSSTGMVRRLGRKEPQYGEMGTWEKSLQCWPRLGA